MNDPLTYPVAMEFIPFGSPVHVDGHRAHIATGDLIANGEAVAPTFKGDATGYEQGQTMRVRPIEGEGE